MEITKLACKNTSYKLTHKRRINERSAHYIYNRNFDDCRTL